MNKNNQKESMTNQSEQKLLNPILIAIIIVVAISIGGLVGMKAGLFTLPNWLAKNIPESTMPLLPQTGNVSSEEVTLSMMVETGRPGVCEIIQKDNPEEKMIYYIDGKKMKIVINNIIDEKTHVTNILTDVDWQYTWVEGEIKGTKMRIPSEEELQEMQEETEEFIESQELEADLNVSTIEADEDDRYDIDCQLKKVDSSIFNIPTDIEFTDLSEVMEDLGNLDFGTDSSEDFSFDQADQAKMEEWAKEMQETIQIEE